MTVKERIISIRLLEKQKTNALFFNEIRVTTNLRKEEKNSQYVLESDTQFYENVYLSENKETIEIDSVVFPNNKKDKLVEW